jgi:hypothetical protein
MMMKSSFLKGSEMRFLACDQPYLGLYSNHDASIFFLHSDKYAYKTVAYADQLRRFD